MLKFYEEVLAGDCRLMMLYGEVGTGKTLLSSCCINMLVDKGYSAKFYHAGQIIRQMMDNVAYNEIIFDMMGNRLTVIDDVKTATCSEFTRKTFSDIINMLFIEGKSLLMTANSQRKELQEKYLGARGYDRFYECRDSFVEFNWPSFRGYKI